MNLFNICFQVLVSIAVSLILIIISSFVIDKIKNRSHRLLNPTEYFPDEEIKTLKQVYYLVLMFIIVLSITNFFFDEGIILRNNPEFYIFNSILDIIVSIYIATFLYRENWKKNIILIIFLLPVPSIVYLIFGTVTIDYWDFIRIPALLYLIKHLYDKLKNFTDEHNLGLSIILLFLIVILSIISTILLENKNPLDAIVMVSNAFTSNGYAILGNTPGGKINSVVLVWSGYIISGAATATLTAAIILRNIQHRLDEYNKKVDDLQSSINRLDEKLDEQD